MLSRTRNCKFAASVALWVLLAARSLAQSGPPPTSGELLRILRITSFRVRVPSDPKDVWDIQVLRPNQLKVTGTRPKGLTAPTELLAFRDKGESLYEFTLPEKGGAFSQGDFDLCKQISCEGQYSLKWLRKPRYSIDGNQCVLAEFANLSDVKPSAFIVLVRARSSP